MARRGQVNREALLLAGYQAIATLGWPAATTAEICRRAGVSSGTFFHYFPTKEDLLLALLTDSDAPASDGFAGLIEEVVQESRDPLMPAFVVEVAALVRLPRVRSALQTQEDTRRARLREAVAVEHRAGRLRQDTDPDVLVRRAELLIAGFETLAATPQADVSALAGTLRESLRDLIGWT